MCYFQGENNNEQNESEPGEERAGGGVEFYRGRVHPKPYPFSIPFILSHRNGTCQVPAKISDLH